MSNRRRVYNYMDTINPNASKPVVLNLKLANMNKKMHNTSAASVARICKFLGAEATEVSEFIGYLKEKYPSAHTVSTRYSEWRFNEEDIMEELKTHKYFKEVMEDYGYVDFSQLSYFVNACRADDCGCL